MDIQQVASMGGKARALSLSKERRREIALKALEKRYSKSYLQASSKPSDMPQFDKCKTCGRMRYKHVYKLGEVGYHEFIPL